MRDLFLRAAVASQIVYEKNTDLGTTEFAVTHPGFFKGKLVEMLTFCGTNEGWDWAKNINLSTKEGIKKVSLEAAEEVNRYFRPTPGHFLVVTGHSKGASEALAYKKKFGADYCIAFAPARMIDKGADPVIPDTTVFVDPDDPVSKLGRMMLALPECEYIYAPDDHIGLSVGDHFMDNWVEFLS